jgi:hypothetical protein
MSFFNCPFSKGRPCTLSGRSAGLFCAVRQNNRGCGVGHWAGLVSPPSPDAPGRDFTPPRAPTRAGLSAYAVAAALRVAR